MVGAVAHVQDRLDRIPDWLGGLASRWSVPSLGIDPEGLSEGTRRQIQVLTAATLLFLGVAAGALVHAAAIGRWFEALYVSLATAAGIANLGLLRRTRDPLLCGHIAVGLIFALMAAAATGAGGFYHPSFAWTYLIPLGAAIAVDTRGAIG